jgi:hypothetical protein
MTDVLNTITGFLKRINIDEVEEIFDEDPLKIYNMLSQAADEIERLREVNSDMGWRLNPDRMGGQFTEEEKNRTGWI